MNPIDKTAPSQTESISFEFDLHHSPEKVWRALTDPVLLTEWLLPVVELKLEPGAAFTFKTQPYPGWDGIVNCRILEAGNMKKSRSKKAESPSELIDARIEDLGDWRGEMLSRLRALIKEADPEVAEEWKWRGTPVWSHNGLICTGETYKNVVKMTFAKGASLKDPSGLFNSSLEGNARRAIDFHEGDKLDEEALKALIRAAVALNKSSARG
jgi:hypothetical protein